MFDFKILKFDKRVDQINSNSFVGIRRSRDNELVFRLPYGFESFPENSYNDTKKLFFRMYKTFKKFEKDIKDRIQEDEKPSGKDQIEKICNAYLFKDKDDESVILYSKIMMLDSVLEAYNELALNTIERRLWRSERIDYSKIYRYLDKAIFLENNIPFVQEMELPQNIILYDSNDLIELFCFIIHEIQRELEQETDERIKALSISFQEKHLSEQHSLFSEFTFEQTISILKETLDKIDKQIAYKDEDYWQIFEAIETFLYSEIDLSKIDENGVFWGISKFESVWEYMCSTYAFRNFENILYADSNVTINGKSVANKTVGGRRVYVNEKFENPFFIEFRNKKRWLRPDLVRSHKNRELIGDNGFIQIYQNISPVYQSISDASIVLHNKKDKDLKDIYDKIIYKLQLRINKKNKTGARSSKKNDFHYNFYHYPKNELDKEIREISASFPTNSQIKLVDWKYHLLQDYTHYTLNQKVKSDIKKQLVYEYCLEQEFPNDIIENQFVIPFYYENTHPFPDNDDIGEVENERNLNIQLSKNNITVFKANFFKIQEEYLLET